ncbi:hypothetical protein BpHYR1_046890 [Brachionus plicatilis]|uniref:Uncharacterized protein n=1 Tax=Brachionus plicatilis TaxID=10195 RepID=A0A3M7PVQ2_BRAPC|nr:hypothetical protein BpHYR1_046890 [Brachionus plicatilis]
MHRFISHIIILIELNITPDQNLEHFFKIIIWCCLYDNFDRILDCPYFLAVQKKDRLADLPNDRPPKSFGHGHDIFDKVKISSNNFNLLNLINFTNIEKLSNKFWTIVSLCFRIIFRTQSVSFFIFNNYLSCTFCYFIIIFFKKNVSNMKLGRLKSTNIFDINIRSPHGFPETNLD